MLFAFPLMVPNYEKQRAHSAAGAAAAESQKSKKQQPTASW